jgi:hypothetical protein
MWSVTDRKCTHCGTRQLEVRMMWGYQPDGVTYGWRCRDLDNCIKRVQKRRRR